MNQFESREEKIKDHADSIYTTNDHATVGLSLAAISNFVVLPSGDEVSMKEYLVRVGPLTVNIHMCVLI